MSRFAPHAVLVAMAALCALAAFGVASAVALPSGDEYNAPGYVVRHAWTKYAYLAGAPFRDDLSRGEEDARVARFFELNALIRDGERTAGNPATDEATRASTHARLEAWREERASIENSVEAILEGRLTATVKDLGLTRRFGGDIVWPPVDIEFEDTPSVLVESPRSEIRKESERLLDGDLTIERVQAIEAHAERDGETSALVVRIGGIALYPALIPPSGDYHFVLQDIAHEWLHHYLYFTPLGRRYYDSAELRTLNETVANIAGDEIGDEMFARYPLPGAQPEASATAQAPDDAAPTPAPTIDFTAEMRGLRRNVEALLADGKIDEAERLMEEKREFLADNGYYIRKLNQAYFAFHGSYADTAGSIDPIGPKLQALRDETGSVTAFVHAAQELTGEAGLDAPVAGGGG
ncbi:MAG TPA: hypothetical protein VFH62_07485 [Dehalococcoidia bacterium]|nr:hypothetical protein [Dehalococcoidia bacterium]